MHEGIASASVRLDKAKTYPSDVGRLPHSLLALFTVFMDMNKNSGFVGALSVVDTGRRRRRSVAEKVRIVEESFAGERQALRTARRHDIAPSLIYKWRKADREGRLDDSTAPSFIPARIVVTEGAAAGPLPTPLPTGGRMEILVSRDRRIIVGADVDAAALGRVLDVLAQR